MLLNQANEQTEKLLNRVDPVSGNEVPPGADPEEVRDNIPALLSKNEYVLPANVVKYVGLDNIQKMHKDAERALNRQAGLPEEYRVGTPGDRSYAEGGGVLSDEQQYQRTTVSRYENPETGNSMLVTFFDGEPIFKIPEGFVASEAATPSDEDPAPTPAQSPAPSATFTPQAQVNDNSSGDGGGMPDGSPEATVTTTGTTAIDDALGKVTSKFDDVQDKLASFWDGFSKDPIGFSFDKASQAVSDKVDEIGDKLSAVGDFFSEPTDTLKNIGASINTTNAGRIGSTIGGFAGPVGTVIGAAAGDAIAAQAGDDTISNTTGLTDETSFLSGFLNSLSFGMLGTSMPDQVNETLTEVTSIPDGMAASVSPSAEAKSMSDATSIEDNLNPLDMTDLTTGHLNDVSFAIANAMHATNSMGTKDENIAKAYSMTPNAIMASPLANPAITNPEQLGTYGAIAPSVDVDMNTVKGQAIANNISEQKQGDLNATYGVGPGTDRSDMHAEPGEKDEDGFYTTQPTTHMNAPTPTATPVDWGYGGDTAITGGAGNDTLSDGGDPNEGTIDGDWSGGMAQGGANDAETGASGDDSDPTGEGDPGSMSGDDW